MRALGRLALEQRLPHAALTFLSSSFESPVGKPALQLPDVAPTFQSAVACNADILVGSDPEPLTPTILPTRCRLENRRYETDGRPRNISQR